MSSDCLQQSPISAQLHNRLPALFFAEEAR